MYFQKIYLRFPISQFSDIIINHTERLIYMEIRKTRSDELETLMKMYENARIFMAENGNPDQWGKKYPERSVIASDIDSGCSYICEHCGRIIAVFYYKTGPDDTYLHIRNGRWLNDLPYGVVHRIVSDGTVKGAASFCLDWAFSQCDNLKIDTHTDNKIMQHLLEKNGFKYCGIINTDDGTERMAYQKEV